RSLVNRWKNAHELRSWSVPLLTAALLGLVAGCSGGGSSIATHRPNEAAGLDGGSTAEFDDVTSRPTVGDGGGGVTPPSLDGEDAATRTPEIPPLDGESEPPLVWNGSPAYSDYVRLTHQQWENSVVA